MAYETGTASSQEDLISKLFTFATANGWTQDELDLSSNEATMHIGSDMYVGFRWDGSEGGGANNIALYQSLGYTPGNAPYAHPNDSGNGTSGTALNVERRVGGIGNGPFTSYSFFQDSSPDHIWVVLEYSPGLYRHFGFGTIDKIGDWDGGEFVAGHVWGGSNVVSGSDTLLLDGRHTSTTDDTERDPATLHVEGLPNQPGSSKWANVGTGSGSAWTATDTAGNSRMIVIGGFRAGPWVNMFGFLPATDLNGYVPLIPIPLIYEDTIPSPDPHWYLLGFAPNVRHVQLTNFNPGDEITVGSDTWVLFPAVRKRNEQDGAQESRDMGIAYKKVT